MTQRALAATLGVKSASVSAWKDASARPECHFRQAIEHLLGIPADDWMTDGEFRIAKRRRRRKPHEANATEAA